MPKEIIERTGKTCFADVMVRWGKPQSSQLQGGDARVDLFMISRNSLGQIDGSFWFEPNEHSSYYEEPLTSDKRPSMQGPVSVDLNRQQINRLIRTLRTARDQAYGRDE